MDAWLREAEEASQWVEDLETKLDHKNLNLAQTITSFSANVADSARSKLLELGVKLDRIESLLRNPPTKPILTDEDVDFRWKMLSDIQLRTRTLARSLYALPSPNRKVHLSVFALLLMFRPKNDPATGSKEYNVSTDFYDQDLVKTSYSQDHSVMLKPLLSDDVNRSQAQMQPFSFMSTISLRKACSILFLFLGVAALLFVLVLICNAI